MAEGRRFLPPAKTKPERPESAHPWIIRVIVVVLVVVVIGGIVWAASLGHFF